MTTIRMLHEFDPGTPATEQHPDAVRYPVVVGAFRFADCVGGPPTQAELEALLKIDATGQAAAARLIADEQERQSCKLDPQILPLVNQDKATWISWAGTNFPTLTAAEKTRLGMLFWVVSVGVRRAIRNGG